MTDIGIPLKLADIAFKAVLSALDTDSRVFAGLPDDNWLELMAGLVEEGYFDAEDACTQTARRASGKHLCGAAAS